MAPTRGTPTRPIRIDPTLWERFGVSAGAVGLDRSAVLREFIRWYVREPGVRMPKRPEAAAGIESGE